MKCFQPFPVLALIVLGGAGLLFSPNLARAGGAVVYAPGGAYGANVYSPPLYRARGANVYSPPLYRARGANVYSPPLYGGYAAPAPVSYGGFVAPYPPVAPIGHALIPPRDGMEIKYKYEDGLWYVEVD